MKLIGRATLTVLLLGCTSAGAQQAGDTPSTEREPGPSFEGTTWAITSFNTSQKAMVSPVSGTSLSIRFKGGAVSGKSGCNNFSGSYTLNGNAITIAPLATTRKACLDDAVATQEQLVLAAIQSTVTWTVHDGLLDLVRPDGARALTAHPSSR